MRPPPASPVRGVHSRGTPAQGGRLQHAAVSSTPVRWLGVWLAMTAAVAACGRAPAFACTQDAECGAGQCEPSSGYCSFLDDACPTGWKYGAHAGQGLAGHCVDPQGGSDDAGTTDAADDVADAGPGPGTTAPGSDDGEPTTGPTGSSSSTTDGSEGGPSCDGGACLDAPPAGWLGPAAVVTSVGSIPSCPQDLPTTLVLGHTMLEGDPAECACGCDPVPDSCGDITISVDEVGATCDMGVSVALAEGDCVDLTSTATSATVAQPVDAGAGTCETNTSMQVTPPAWLDHLRVCGTDEPAACEGGTVCLPTVPDADACIMRAGDVPCPAGDYSVRTVVYGDYVDERDCSACDCDVQGPVCRVELRYGDDCSGNPDVAWTTNTAHCETFAIPAGEAFTAMHDTVDNCVGDGGDPIGAVVPIDPTTLCCMR